MRNIYMWLPRCHWPKAGLGPEKDDKKGAPKRAVFKSFENFLEKHE